MRVFLSFKADRQLRKLPHSMHQVLLRRIKKLSLEPFPHGAKKLVNRSGWRLRLGDYRILYAVDRKQKEITVLSVSHRREAYRLI